MGGLEQKNKLLGITGRDINMLLHQCGVSLHQVPISHCPKDAAELVQRRVTVRIKGMKQLSCGDGFDRGDSSACRADKVKEDVIEGYKIMTGLEKMSREGDSGSLIQEQGRCQINQQMACGIEIK